MGASGPKAANAEGSAGAGTSLDGAALEVSGVLRKYQLKLADRQCRMAESSQRLQDVIVMLCTALYAARQNDEITRQAADVFCQEMRRKLTEKRPSDKYFRAVTKLGETIAENGCSLLSGVEEAAILMPYTN